MTETFSVLIITVSLPPRNSAYSKIVIKLNMCLLNTESAWLGLVCGFLTLPLLICELWD